MRDPLFDLAGRNVLVTGTSSGFGAHFCRVLAQRGAKVIAAARRLDAFQALVSEITAQGGVAPGLRLDVSDAAGVREALTDLGLLDVVINNAGVAGRAGRSTARNLSGAGPST